MKLSFLLASLPSPPPLPASDLDITSVVFDSRLVTPGSLFVAIRGDTSDGHRFISDALARGAAAIVYDDPSTLHAPRFPLPPPPSTILVPDSRAALAHLAAAWHGFPARRLVMIGVTGTDGKTTTANLIHSILKAAGIRAGLISTVNAVIAEGETLDTGFHVTTPDAPAVHSYLRRMADSGLTHCVLEATSHGLAQHRVTACEFDFAAVTNITHEHLDFHRTFEDYRAAKARLFEMLSETFPKDAVPRRAAILNRDDPSYEFLSARAKVAQFSYSLGEEGDVRASGIVYEGGQLAFDVAGPGFAFRVRAPLVGQYNVSNCLAAIGVTVCGLGVPPDAVQRGLAEFPGVPGRMERIDLGQPFTALVDFAHTPNGLRRALETARAMTSSRVLAVFGSAGLRDKAKRRLMAETSAQLADLTLLTAEDPRTESLTAILAEMAEGCEAQGGEEGKTYRRIEDRGEAIRFAVNQALPGDVVIACGKGHEQTMAFGETEYPWDDRTAMGAALAELLGVEGPKMPKLPTS